MIGEDKKYDLVDLPEGGKFELSFKGISIKDDTLVINAERQETMRPEFWVVSFKGVGNIQLLLNVNNEGILNRFASYTVRSYTTHPRYPDKRV